MAPAPGEAVERGLRTLLRWRQQAAAKNIRLLHALSVSTRKTIDTMIAARGITGGDKLLYRDRDFDPIVKPLQQERLEQRHAAR